MTHEPDCPVVRYRAQLDAELAADPTNPYLLGARPEYYGWGDQEAENCTCFDVVDTDHGWTVYRTGQVAGWVRHGDDTETCPPGTFLSVSRHPLRNPHAGEPLTSQWDAIQAILESV